MAATFDPYYTWLAIPPEEQPPHLYRLLALKPLEDNLDVIENAADQRMLHLRTFQSGKQSELSQKLLNEIATAKVTLLDPAKKSAYDTELRAKLNAAKQAEQRKSREERPLAMAKPLAAQPIAAAQPQFVAPARIAARRKSNSLGLIIAGVAVLLVLGIGGAAAMMLLRERPRVADNSTPATRPNNIAEKDPIAPAEVAPVVPPVIPPTSNKPPQNDAPPNAQVPADEPTEPAEDEPTDEAPLGEDSLDEPFDGEEVVDEPLAPTKYPVPEKAQREVKRKEILQVFAVADARTFEQKSTLAANLIRTAGETVDDPAALFALLNLAREQAAEAGNIQLAFDATDALADNFEFDGEAVRLASLQQAARATLPPAAKREIVVAGMSIIDELASADKFTEADALSDRLLAIARPLRDAELIKSLADQRRVCTELAVSFKKAQSAFETLKTSPDDAEANLAAGRYLTFIKQDWDAGLAHLAKGSDAALAAAAKAELASPAEPQQQLALADAWWTAAAAQKDLTAKDACRAQAVAWYSEIVDELVGLTKARVEKNIAEAGEPSTTRRTASTRVKREVEVVYLDDLAEVDVHHGHHPLQKHGHTFADGGTGEFNGEVPKHSLSIHGIANGAVGVSYKLDGTYEIFEGVAAQWEDHVAGRSGSPLIFTVFCDDKLTWKSEPIQVHGTGQPFKIPVKGVQKLTLRMDCGADSSAAWPVWIYPRLSKFKSVAPTTTRKLPKQTLRIPISANVDGVDMVRVFATQAEWHHKAHEAPSEVSFNGQPWNTQAMPILKFGDDVVRRVGKLDIASAELLPINPPGPLHMEKGPDYVDIVFDHGKVGGRGRYNVVLVIRTLGEAFETPEEPDLGVFSRDPDPASRPRPTAKPEPVYLDDLAETSVVVGAGELGKHGQGGGNGEFEGKKIEHSLTTHAVTDGIAHVAYDLGGKYETFAGAVGLWALPGRSPKSGAPIVFQIIGDEKPLWRSKPLQTLGVSEPFRVRVRGVKALRLEAHCAGNHVDGWAVWLEPRVTPKN